MSLKIYKRGQGYYTRLYSAIIAAVVVLIGCYILSNKLVVFGNIWVQYFVPAAVWGLFVLLISWLSNKPSVADFLISAENELKKVSWSSRREIMVSTFIVICVVALMAVTLLITDLFFQIIFRKMGVY